MTFPRWTLLLLCYAAAAQTPERAMLAAIERDAPQAVALLEKLVNQNSGTFHRAGVAAVAAMMDAELRALGFETKLLPGDALGRGPHLSARRKNARLGKPLLLIGHMDTVFEPSSPFQRFERKGDQATGPGVNDMKGGLVVMLSALKALQQASLLEGAPIEIFLTGDEEAPGNPVAAARRDLIAAGKNARAALCFESGRRIGESDYISTARRGFLGWELRSTGVAGHSGRIFTESLGHGAIYEVSRVLSQFHDQLREPNLTFSVGLVLGGSSVKADAEGAATAQGKPNIIPGEALARGDIRALTQEQVSRVKDKMYAIVAKSLPGTKSEIRFNEDGYPAMAPSPGNKRLLAAVNEASRRAGLPEAQELDPMERGAGDISFIAPYVDSLTGMGAIGGGAHAVGESVDLASLPRTIQRAAVAILSLSK
ncbi:MAG: M20/M25/M40 family metallo-hydrolase [Bryobacteraceae bacterium]|nr:M20/M25/M40 family metallo-hydrolase [Bryobacteraceae bacterium]